MNLRRVLIVDDDPNVLKSLARLLRVDEYVILTAKNGFEALDILRQHPIDVLISDLKMPRMDGLEFLRNVQDLHPYTVKILLTAYADLETALKTINEVPVFRFITKPWNGQELKQTIRSALRVAMCLHRARSEAQDIIAGVQDISQKNLGKDESLKSLEKQFPGITKVDLDENGCYVLK